MSDKENELLYLIHENEYELKHARIHLSDLKLKLTEADTRLIGLKLENTRLNNQLRCLRNSSIPSDPDPNEVVDERFRQRLPELLEKIK